MNNPPITPEQNTPATPIHAMYADLSTLPNRHSLAHHHSALEFVIILDGTLQYTVEKQTFHLYPGDSIFINTNRLHAYGAIEAASQDNPNDSSSFLSQNCHFAVLQIEPELLYTPPAIAEKYVYPLLLSPKKSALIFDQSENWHTVIVSELAALIQLVTEKTDGFELTVQSKLYHFWHILYQHNILKDEHHLKHSAQTTQIQHMITYLHTHYQEKITLTDIAGAGMMCQSKCCRLFRSTLNQSPMEYLQNYRIKKSTTLLSHSALSITEIALECGFHGASYFSETFRKLYGISPKEYRKEAKKKTVKA